MFETVVVVSDIHTLTFIDCCEALGVQTKEWEALDTLAM